MRYLKRLIYLFAIFILHGTSYADDVSVKKFRNFTPEQIKEIPRIKRQKSVPIMYIWAAQEGLSPDANMVFGAKLNNLMYQGIHNYEAAVKEFQHDLGEKETGILTVGQIRDLGYRSDKQKLGRVLFPSQYSSSIYDNYSHIEGTMIIHDDKIAWPINHVKINCYKKEKRCELNQINLSIPDENSWTQQYSIVEDSTQFFKIVRWDANIIDAIPDDNSKGCRTTSLNLNFKTKEYYYITRNSDGNCQYLGVNIPKLDKPRISQIIDGEEILYSEFKKIEQAAFSFYASKYKEKVRQLIKKTR